VLLSVLALTSIVILVSTLIERRRPQ